jgi:pyruvate-formate lyase-activating enzyme
VDTGWVRLTRTCNNACLFCLDAENLDGRPIELDEIQRDIDAVAEAGLSAVVLSGGEPTLSKHLLGAIRYAKGKGLRTILTTNARIIQSDKIAQMLEKAGLDEIRISVHAARRATHETMVQREKAWVETNAAVKYMGRTSVRVVCNAVLTRPGKDELAYLMHLLMMGGMKEYRVRRMLRQGAGASDVAKAELAIAVDPSLLTITDLWYGAKEEVVHLIVEGFDHTMDEGLLLERPVRQADIAALELLRQRVQLHHAAHGLSLLDEEGMGKDLTALCEFGGGLADVGHELAARLAPLTDAPPCVGGRVTVAPDHWGEDAVYGAGCAACPERSACPGLPRKLGKLAKDHLTPLPQWGPAPGPFVVLRGRDAHLEREVLAPLADALAALGADVSRADDAAGIAAGTVICGPDQVGTAPGVRWEALDLGQPFAATPTVLRSHVPGRVEVLREAGVPLRSVRWRPFPAQARCASAPPVEGCEAVVALGRTADWDLLLRTRGWATAIGAYQVYDHADNPAPDHPGLVRHTDVDDDALLEAILGARLVVFPHRRQTGDSAADRAALWSDLRWLHVAAAAGRPVVATRGPGVEDGVRHGKTGWLVRPGDAAELAVAARDLFAKPDRLAATSRSARELGALSSPETWARELVSGARPAADPLWKTPLRPWPRW